MRGRGRAVGRALGAAVVTAWMGGARAEPPPLPPEDTTAAPTDPVPADPEPPPAPPEAAAPAPPDPRGWQLYHRAFAALARRHPAAARAVLQELTARYPGHPAAVRAAEVLGRMRGEAPSQVIGRPAAPPPRPEPRPDEPETPTRLARAELAIFQTFHGAVIGAEVCILAECNDAAGAIGLVLLGGVAGALGSVGATSGGIEPGRRGAIDSGVTWGAFNGAMALVIAEPDEPASIGGVMLGAQLTGLLVGDLVWRAARPTEGQVALSNTFAIWSGVGAALGLVALEVDPTADAIGTTLLAAVDAGLIAGSLVATRAPMSRGRTLLIDSGGIVGGLVGGGSAVLIEGDDTRPEVAAGAALAGLAVGLAAAAYLSRAWDD